MALLTPREENITGVDLSGATSTANRTYTLVHPSPSSTGIQIKIQGTPLHQGSGRDFTIAISSGTGIITFLNYVLNDQLIDIYYFTSGDASSTASGLGSATAVRRILNKTEASLDDDTVNAFIEEAARKLRGKYFSKYMLDKDKATSIQATGAVNRVYETYFTLKPDTTGNTYVYINGVLKTVTSDYTIDFDASTITINSDVTFNHSDDVGIFYIPEFFDDFANYIAAKRIVDRGLVDLPQGTQGGFIYNNIRFTVKEYEDMVKMKPYVGSFVDHREDGGIY